MATFCWEAGEQAGRRLAAVQLTELKATARGAARAAGPAEGLAAAADRRGDLVLDRAGCGLSHSK